MKAANIAVKSLRRKRQLTEPDCNHPPEQSRRRRISEASNRGKGLHRKAQRCQLILNQTLVHATVAHASAQLAISDIATHFKCRKEATMAHAHSCVGPKASFLCFYNAACRDRKIRWRTGWFKYFFNYIINSRTDDLPTGFRPVFHAARPALMSVARKQIFSGSGACACGSTTLPNLSTPLQDTRQLHTRDSAKELIDSRV